MIQHIFISAAEVAQEAVKQEASGGVLGTLGINWKLFLAQLVNFAIVLFVFWKWVVKPLGGTLTERQNRIESGLKSAQLMEDEKKNFDVWKQDEMKKVRGEAETIIKMASDTATRLKADVAIDAQKQSAKILDQAHAQIESEKNQMLKEIRQEVATLVVTASEKILRSKLDPKKDQALIEESVRQAK